jgi:4-hydroxy-tetrahydrodipicolinate synthase
MDYKGLEGVFPVLTLPFTEDREVDYGSLKKLIDFLIDKKVDGLAVFGLNTEFYKINDDEAKKVTELLVKHNNGRVKLAAGVGKPGTETTIRQAQFCQELGIDALIIFPPYCVPVSPGNLFQHYVDVSSSVRIPIIIQDSPKYSGVNMDIDFFKGLSEKCSNIKYAKIENQLSGPKISKIIESSKGRIKVFAGKGGTHFIEHLKRNVCGIMPGCALIELFVDIFKKFKNKKFEEADSIFEDMATLLYLEDQEIEYYIACEKEMLKYRGIIDSSQSRRPSAELDSISRHLLQEKLKLLIDKFKLEV